jgi:hypothetical protein
MRASRILLPSKISAWIVGNCSVLGDGKEEKRENKGRSANKSEFND